ncbi:MAG: TetR/AcrR family transcriptional regulator [Candidatus Zixiibacteriota bacterium]
MKKDGITKDDKGRAEGSAAKILAAARAEFAAYGLAGARVDRIAEQSGINKAMIYYHFGSKENLYQEVIKEVIAGIAAFLSKVSTEVASPMEILEKVAAFYQDMFYRAGDFRAIFLRELAAGGGRLKEAFAAVFSEQEVHKKMKAIIDQGKKTGLFRDVDSTHAIISFMGMNIFYFIASPIINQMWEIKNEERFLQKRKTEVPDLFLHGLLAK